ncbi:Hypothetical_protein [Hexamita inflata]|uniref:Hypothetical_protein n=1 Tax=Hexamita inflata TaxID=28002 RepID=A0AA86QYW2_9EUKA|nr:Hypothetical protein HINF_LOCUS49899 [Hexamita inflata]
MQFIKECYKYYNLKQVDDHFIIDLVASKKCGNPNNSYPFELLVLNKQYTTKFQQNAFLTFRDQQLDINCLNTESYENCVNQIQIPFSSSELLVNGEKIEHYNKYRSDMTVFWVLIGAGIVVVVICIIIAYLYCLKKNKQAKQVLAFVPDQESYGLLEQK